MAMTREHHIDEAHRSALLDTAAHIDTRLPSQFLSMLGRQTHSVYQLIEILENIHADAAEHYYRRYDEYRRSLPREPLTRRLGLIASGVFRSLGNEKPRYRGSSVEVDSGVGQ